MNTALRRLKGRKPVAVKKSNRKPEGKRCGAYVPDEQNEALKALAKSKGYHSVAALARAIYDAALAEGKIDQ